MGLSAGMKSFFGIGRGVEIDAIVSPTFRWSDESLPVQLQITGHASEGRVIQTLELRFEADRSALRRQSAINHGRPVLTPSRSHRVLEPILLSASETRAIALAVPLAKDPGAPSALSAIAGAVEDRAVHQFRIFGNARIEGYLAQLSFTSNITSCGAEWHLSSGGVNL